MKLPEEIEDHCKKLLSEKDYVGVMKLWKENVFPKDMSYAEAEPEWYKALFKEDCLRIMKLLTMHPTLVKVGWGKEDSRIVEGSPESHQHQVGKYLWQGRTALHVNARRGCIELLRQVLELYGLNVRGPSDPSESEKTDRQVNVCARSPSNTREEKDISDVSSFDHTGQRNGENAGCSSHSTDTEERSAGIPSGDGATSDTRSSKDTEGRESKRHDDEIVDNRAHKDNDRNRDGIGTGFSPQKDLFDLLVSKDGIYKIDALAIAILHFKSDIFNLLLYAIGECKANPYGIEKIPVSKYDKSSQGSSEDDLLKLRNASKKSLLKRFFFSTHAIERFLEDYSILHRDFNFYPAGFLEYALHFCFTDSSREREPPVAYFQFAATDVLGDRASSEKRSSRASYGFDLKFYLKFAFLRRCWETITGAGESLWSFVLKLQDGQGRTPLHVFAAEKNLSGLRFATWIFAGKDHPEIVASLHTILDGAGRPLPNWIFEKITGRAARRIELAEHSVLNTPAVLGEEGSVQTWAETLNEVFKVNGFHRSNARLDDQVGVVMSTLLADIIRRDVTTPELLRSHFRNSRPRRTSCRLTIRDAASDLVQNCDYVQLGPLDLACLMVNHEDKEDCEYLLQLLNEVGDQVIPFQKGSTKEAGELYHGRSVFWVRSPFQALHIVAGHGNYKVLKMFLDHPSCDPFVEDYQGNNALHYAMQEPFDRIEPSLLDYVSCQDLLKYRPSQTDKDILNDNMITERQGCVSLLLRAGCEIFKGNYNGQVPYPQGRIANSVKFVSWWHERQEKEFATATSSFNTATNAISVTAALVATASYVGPLQPPLSYGVDPTNNVNQIQYEKVWVATFLFCDTLSFYLAIIAIILSLIPSLPVPQQAMVLELQRTKTMMIMAVSVLIPSIICVLIAFAASSMAVVSAGNITSSIGGKLTIATLSISGPFFLAAILLFSIRLLIILFPRTRFIRYVYERTSFGIEDKKRRQIIPEQVGRVRKLVRTVRILQVVFWDFVTFLVIIPVASLIGLITLLPGLLILLPGLSVHLLVRKVMELPQIVEELVKKARKLQREVRRVWIEEVREEGRYRETFSARFMEMLNRRTKN